MMVEQRDASMEENIDSVVTQGGDLAHQVVQSKGEDSDGSVGLVTLLLGDGSSPEIILENVGQRHVRSEVPAEHEVRSGQ